MNKEKLYSQNWIAPSNATLPDFIIGGAMKSGTTTLHDILNSHPSVYIPREEVGFFDIDNILQHNDFIFFDELNNKWIEQRLEDNPSKFWEWYSSKFVGKENFLIGEDSTSYLASKRAAKRIAQQNKDIKIIFSLRNPTDRAYSNYWHMLRKGRAIYSFENTIRYEPHKIIERSLYKDQLEYYYDIIPNDRIMVVTFEEMINNTEKELKKICNFLELDYNLFEAEHLKIHSSKSKLPRWFKLQLYRNMYLKELAGIKYKYILPNKLDHKVKYSHRLVNKSHNIINPMKIKKPPKMKEATRRFLDNFFYHELSGLNEIVGFDILNDWFPSKK